MIFSLVTSCWSDIHTIILKTLIPVLLVYSNFSDRSPSFWKWRRPTWSEGGGSCQVVITGMALGLCLANLNMCQVQTSPGAEPLPRSGRRCPASGGWGLCLAPWSLRWVWPASISCLCLKWSVCFLRDIKCCRSPWFFCLLEVQVILFSVLELFYGEVKVEGGFSVTFSFLWQIAFIYSVLQYVVYSICSDIKQLPCLKPEVAAAILECLCKLTSNPQGWRALLKM